jgi:PAS domain S-box-containing protein
MRSLTAAKAPAHDVTDESAGRLVKRARTASGSPVRDGDVDAERSSEPTNLVAAELLTEQQIPVNHRLLFNMSSVAMDIVTPTGQFVDCNARFIELMGFSKEALLDRQTFYSLTHPDSISHTMDFVKALLAAPVGRPLTTVKKYISQQGRVFQARLTCWVVVDNQSISYIYGMVVPREDALAADEFAASQPQLDP